MLTADQISKLTPAMRQFHHFKEQYPDAILFFRMGDFYETFYRDAEISARVLGISLTCRNKTSDNPIPLAGIPYHALDGYLKKMIQAGHKVAICEQIEDPKKAVGVVKRDVVRLVTAGTLTEDSLLNEHKGNFLASICFNTKDKSATSKIGLAWVELSTGQFFAQCIEARYAVDELLRLGPAECIINEESDAYPEGFIKHLRDILDCVITTQPGWAFEPQHANEALKKQFKTKTLEGFGFDNIDVSIQAAGGILEYLMVTQKIGMDHISQIKRIASDLFLRLDQTTLRSLEIEKTTRDNLQSGSLLHTIDKTKTAMGSRMMRHWICYPLNEISAITARQNAITELLQTDDQRDALRKCLGEVSDIERITARISTNRAKPRDFLALGYALSQLPAIQEILKSYISPTICDITKQCDTLDDIADLIEKAIHPDCGITIKDGGIINDGYNEEIDRLRVISCDGQTWLANYQKKLSAQINFSHIKVGYNRVFGYFVEITKSFTGTVPDDFIRKQTLKNAERYITDELKLYEADALTAQQRCKDLEASLFNDVRESISKKTPLLQQISDAVSNIDVLSALATLARNHNYCKPEIHASRETIITEGRHPVLDQTLGNHFIANDVSLGKDADLVIITGPNMAGKSTYIRQTALLVLLAHTGSYIPADKAVIGLVDRIFTRVGANDELTRGQSTFMVEMNETANIINNATDRSLVILDEIGRGTSTYDGLSLAWSISEYIAKKIKCRTLFATHYHEITEMANMFTNVKNEHVSVREWNDEIVFLHKIVPGRTNKSYGIHVAKLAGIPKSVLERANKILADLESNFSREVHMQTISKTIDPKADGGQMMLFNDYPETSLEPDPIIDEIIETKIETLTPIDALNFLQRLKQNIESR